MSIKKGRVEVDTILRRIPQKPLFFLGFFWGGGLFKNKRGGVSSLSVVSSRKECTNLELSRILHVQFTRTTFACTDIKLEYLSMYNGMGLMCLQFGVCVYNKHFITLFTFSLQSKSDDEFEIIEMQVMC